MIKTSKQALSSFLGWDFSELKEYTYQPGRYTKPVYTVDDNYYTVTKGTGKPAQRTRDDDNHEWKEIKDSYINSFGFKIWKA